MWYKIQRVVYVSFGINNLWLTVSGIMVVGRPFLRSDIFLILLTVSTSYLVGNTLNGFERSNCYNGSHSGCNADGITLKSRHVYFWKYVRQLYPYLVAKATSRQGSTTILIQIAASTWFALSLVVMCTWTLALISAPFASNLSLETIEL